MKHFLSYLLFFSLLFVARPCCWAATKAHAVFLSPDHKNGEFFGPLTHFMESAAKSLDIELEVLYADFDRFVMADNAQAVLQRQELPDYLILVNEWNKAPSIIQKADRLGIRTLLFNEGLMDDDKKRYLYGEDRLNNWIGEVIPDDFQAGYLLAKTLLDEAEKKELFDEDGNIHLIGISGTSATRSSRLREDGMRAALRTFDNVILHQIVEGYWKPERAKDITKRLLHRYPETSVIWAASDLMASGAVKGTVASDKIPNKDIVIGGIDWAPFVFGSLETKTITTSIGGHIFDGGWAMVMIYDHFNGNLTDHQSEKTTFSAAHTENVEQLRMIFDKKHWETINFAEYSKSHNPELKQYSFGAQLLLEQEVKPQ